MSDRVAFGGMLDIKLNSYFIRRMNNSRPTIAMNIGIIDDFQLVKGTNDTYVSSVIITFTQKDDDDDDDQTKKNDDLMFFSAQYILTIVTDCIDKFDVDTVGREIKARKLQDIIQLMLHANYALRDNRIRDIAYTMIENRGKT